MDPLSALSLACNVIQIVGTGIEVTKEVAKAVKSSSGLSKANDLIKEDALKLQSLLQGLRSDTTGTQMSLTCANTNITQISQHTSTAVESIARECEAKSEELVALMKALQVDHRRSKFTQIRKGIAATYKKNNVLALQSELERIQSKFQLSLMAEMSVLCREIQTNNIITTFSPAQQSVIQAIADGQNNINMLHNVVVGEGLKTRQHITNVTNEVSTAILQKQSYDKFLEAIKFPSISDRQVQIQNHEAVPETFQWIFEEIERPWSSFTAWLHDDKPVYWTYGKPGSGKSTLMNFIWNGDGLYQHLEDWLPEKTLITTAHWFWASGDPMQRSLQGFLRTLLVQILEQQPNVFEAIRQSSSATSLISSTTAYSESMLLSLLEVSLKNEAYRWFFLIDGLDEYGDLADGYEVANLKILKVIESFQRWADGRIKICVSSRPSGVFKSSALLQTAPKLRLQDLTEGDIEKMISYSLPDPLLVKEFSKYLIHKAEGVFLWVRLAVRAIIASFVHDDSIEEIRRNLQDMPSELDDMYLHMLQRISPVYKKTAGLHLRLATLPSTYISTQLFESLSVVGHVFASDEKHWRTLNNPLTNESATELLAASKRMEKSLLIQSAGLLEVVFFERSASSSVSEEENAAWTSEQDEQSLDSFVRSKVVPVHRSVAEFLIKVHNHIMLIEWTEHSTAVRYMQTLVTFSTLQSLGYLGCLLNGSSSIPDCLCKIMMISRVLEIDFSELMKRLENHVKVHPKSLDYDHPGMINHTTVLDVCASIGAFEYLEAHVHKMLQQDSADILSQLDKLLQCTIGTSDKPRIFLLHKTAREAYIRLIDLLLRHGADPNMVTTSKRHSSGVVFTIWGVFLCQYTHTIPKPSIGILDPCLEQENIAYSKLIVELFLRYGARSDANVPVQIEHLSLGDLVMCINAKYVLQSLGFEIDGNARRSETEDLEVTVPAFPAMIVDHLYWHTIFTSEHFQKGIELTVRFVEGPRLLDFFLVAQQRKQIMQRIFETSPRTEEMSDGESYDQLDVGRLIRQKDQELQQISRTIDIDKERKLVKASELPYCSPYFFLDTSWYEKFGERWLKPW